MAKTFIKKTDKEAKERLPQLSAKVISRQVSQTQKDIADWKLAQQIATLPQDPKLYMLQDIFSHISNDALLTSQMNNRREQTISAPFEMINQDGKIDDNATNSLRNIAVVSDILGYIWDSEMYGSSLVELSYENGMQKATLINRRNVVPQLGRFYPDATMNNYFNYRQVKEYGSWLLEFNSDHVGLLNKAVPHILFKNFAQSCWSELCEIYGIPPRVMKTETRDPAMLNRAQSMMEHVGSAAWFIIDKTEEFDFAKGVATSGDVYNNLINLCNNEISMLISGAIIGQDTKNGNESKEKTSIQILDRLADADKRMAETYMNTVVIPAFIRIGWMPTTTSKFRFSAVENTDMLWSYTQALLPYKQVDNDFILEKFGIKVNDKQEGF